MEFNTLWRHVATYSRVNTESGNGTKPFPKPMSTSHFWPEHENNFSDNAQAIIPYSEFENHICNVILTSPRGQWINPEEISPQ